jgi:thiamine biosynthesis lipoprotein
MTSTLADAPSGQSVRLAIEAMATRFELVLPCHDRVVGGSPETVPAGGPTSRLRAIGAEALADIAQLETRLSFYRAASDISWINAHAGERAVKVEPRLFALFERCLALSEATDGAFDITVGPLMRAWKYVGSAGALPPPELVAEARTRVGYQHLHLDPRESTIRFGRAGMSLDLGAAGKGYAIGAAIRSLRDHGVTSALLHGGTSSVHAIGAADGDAWKIAWAPQGELPLTVELRDSALSVSAVHGKAFITDGRLYGHVIDPRTGWPTDAASSALVTGPDSLECDALSTALLVLGADWVPTMHARFPGYTGLVG